MSQAEDIIRLRAAITAMREDAVTVFRNHHCLVCANGSPCNALVLLSRIQATALHALDPIDPEAYAESDPTALLRDAG
jgi:hypothetical protein